MRGPYLLSQQVNTWFKLYNILINLSLVILYRKAWLAVFSLFSWLPVI